MGSYKLILKGEILDEILGELRMDLRAPRYLLDKTLKEIENKYQREKSLISWVF